MPLFYLPLVLYAGLVEVWFANLPPASGDCPKPH